MADDHVPKLTEAKRQAREHQQKIDAALKQAVAAKEGAVNPRQVVFTTQSRIMECLGFSQALITRWITDPEFPGGREGPWILSKVITWYRGKKPAGPVVGEKSEDPLLVGQAVDSPGLERYRQAKAALAELDLQERTGELISRDKTVAILERWTSIISGMSERLLRLYGPGSVAILDEALLECRHVIDHEFCGVNRNGAGPGGNLLSGVKHDEAADASDDAGVCYSGDCDT